MDYKLSSQLPYPQINFKVDSAFPIKILDGLIEIEEKMQGGFSLYNRGNNLKKSLISADRVKAYLQGQDSKKGPPKFAHAPKLSFLVDEALDNDKQWKMMMEYLKENPKALLDAMPTPTGEEEDDPNILADFTTGLTPKKNFSFKFGDVGPNRPPSLAIGGNFNNKRPASNLSARSNSKSERGTPQRTFPKVYQKGSSRPGSSSS
jgi:hypothetical protein